MKVTYQLSTETASAIALAYEYLRCSQQICRDLAADKETPRGVELTCTDVAATIRGAIERIERGVPKIKEAAFKAQIKDVDPLVFGNVQQLFSRMTAEQKEMLELCAIGILNGEILIQQQ